MYPCPFSILEVFGCQPSLKDDEPPIRGEKEDDAVYMPFSNWGSRFQKIKKKLEGMHSLHLFSLVIT